MKDYSRCHKISNFDSYNNYQNIYCKFLKDFVNERHILIIIINIIIINYN